MNLAKMRISDPEARIVAREADTLDELLHLQGATVLELGCGNAEKTRIVAQMAAAVLAAQKFFLQPMHFANFGQYEEQVLKVTHTEHRLSVKTLEKVHSKFNGHMTREGATFLMPIRIDLLRKTVS